MKQTNKIALFGGGLALMASFATQSLVATPTYAAGGPVTGILKTDPVAPPFTEGQAMTITFTLDGNARFCSTYEITSIGGSIQTPYSSTPPSGARPSGATNILGVIEYPMQVQFHQGSIYGLRCTNALTNPDSAGFVLPSDKVINQAEWPIDTAISPTAPSKLAVSLSSDGNKANISWDASTYPSGSIKEYKLVLMALVGPTGAGTTIESSVPGTSTSYTVDMNSFATQKRPFDLKVMVYAVNNSGIRSASVESIAHVTLNTTQGVTPVAGGVKAPDTGANKDSAGIAKYSTAIFSLALIVALGVVAGKTLLHRKSVSLRK